MTAVNDLRILADVARLIELHECGLFCVNSLTSYMKTKRGKIVGETLVELLDKLYRASCENTRLRSIVDGLRSDMDRASKEILRLERLVGK